jgi:hypothetical protein
MASRRITARSALYLYGVSKSAGRKPGKIAATGIDGIHPVESLPCDGYLCWVSAVDGKGFSDSIRSDMENLEWLALHSVRHQQVVAEIFTSHSIIPARFGTIFSGEPALLKNVQARKRELEKVFKKISGAEEWGVKVFAESGPPLPPLRQVKSGKDYLKLKSARLKQAPDRDSAGLQEFATALEKIALDSAPSGKVSGSQPNLLWQATFLVPGARRKSWEEALRTFVKKWDRKRRIEVNGPWPPYSFVADAE